MEILPESRVMVFDNRLYINDAITPLSVTMKPATVVCRYGIHSDVMCKHAEEDGRPHRGKDCCWNYPDLIDVIFDHDGRLSKGHFTRSVKLIKEGNRDGQ